MVRPNTQTRQGLVPRVIVDVNGNRKTVWVRPDDTSYAANNPIHHFRPEIKKQIEEDAMAPTHAPVGEKQGSLRHTREEKAQAFERGYGSDKLRAAAEAKFERDFGVPIADAPDYDLTSEQLYDYIARGLTYQQAEEFAHFGIEPHLTHPKLDAEYAFVSGPKVTKIDLRNQTASDSYLRKQELREISKTARVLQDQGVSPEVAAKCIENGLRSKHLDGKIRDPKDTIKLSYEHNVESPEFAAAAEKLKVEEPPAVRDSRVKRWVKEQGRRARRAAWRGTKRWARRRVRRIYNGVHRRITRLLKITFLPWKTR